MTPPRILLLSIALVSLFTLPACRTLLGQGRPEVMFAASKTPWRTAVGQLQFVNPKRSVIGGVVVSRRGTEDFRLEFTAGPGVPLLRLQESGTLVRGEGLFARGFWQGPTAKAPRHLESWVTLREIFACLETPGNKRTGSFAVKSLDGAPYPWTATADLTDGKTRRLQVSFTETGERLTFLLEE